MTVTNEKLGELKPTGEATAILPVGGKRSPIPVIGTEAIRQTLDDVTLQQASNTRMGPGVEQVVLNPDAHRGFGAPIGCVLASPSHIYPGPVGVDIKCSMSLLQLDLPGEAIITGMFVGKVDTRRFGVAEGSAPARLGKAGWIGSDTPRRVRGEAAVRRRNG